MSKPKKISFGSILDKILELLKQKPQVPVEPPVDPIEPPIDPIEPPIDPIEPPIDPVDPPVDPVDPIEPPVDPVDPNLTLVKQYNFTLSVDSASGLMGNTYTKAVAIGNLEIKANKTHFSNPSGQTFVISGKVTKMVDKNGNEILKEYISKLDFNNDPMVYTGKTMTLTKDDKDFKVTIIFTISDDWKQINPINSVVDVKKTEVSILIDNVVSRGSAVWVSEHEEIGPVTPVPPEPPIEPPVTPPNQSLIYGLMLTDAICDKELEKYRKDDLIKLKGSYNTILTLVDLQKNGTKPTRPYVDWARTKTDLTTLGVTNLKFLKSQGYKVHLILLNSWGLINGFSAQMASTQKAGLNETNAYTAALLAQEKQFITNLITKYGAYIDGIMPCLESQHPDGARFSYELGKHARNIGFTGVISYNVLGNGGATLSKYDFKGINAFKACSQNNIDAWTSSDNAIRNSDGMLSVAGNTTVIKKIYTNPGPKGFYMWSKDFVGSTSGRQTDIPNIYIQSGGPVTPPVNPPVTSIDSVANQSDEVIKSTMKAWFCPPATYSSDSNSVVSKNFLWKPMSDSDKKLVILTPAGEHIVKVSVNGEIKTPYTIANGNRPHYRFSKAGASYGNAKIILVYKSGMSKTFTLNGSARFEKPLSQIPGLVTTPSGSPTPTPNTDPVPTNGPLYTATDRSITLRADFLACVGGVDALANNNEGANAEHIRILSVRNGATFTLPQPLKSYKVGSIPNTWRIRLLRTPPAGVTYHTSISQTFIRTTEIDAGKGKTYPPTTRQ